MDVERELCEFKPFDLLMMIDMLGRRGKFSKEMIDNLNYNISIGIVRTLRHYGPIFSGGLLNNKTLECWESLIKFEKEVLECNNK